MGRDCASERGQSLAEADEDPRAKASAEIDVAAVTVEESPQRQGLNSPAHPVGRLVSRLPPSQPGMEALRESGACTRPRRRLTTAGSSQTKRSPRSLTSFSSRRCRAGAWRYPSRRKQKTDVRHPFARRLCLR